MSCENKLRSLPSTFTISLSGGVPQRHSILVHQGGDVSLPRVKPDASSSVTIYWFFARDGRSAFAETQMFLCLRGRFSGKQQRCCNSVSGYFVVILEFSGFAVHFIPVQQRIPNPVVVSFSVSWPPQLLCKVGNTVSRLPCPV